MSANTSHMEREFPMSQRDFEHIKQVAYELTGIKLTDHKKNMIYSRLARRIRRRQLGSFRDYCDLISADGSDEITDFINAITTNLTSFFREEHHFDFLVQNVFPELLRHNQGSRRIRIWSAGCSTGEEPYSIAMCLREKMPVESWDIRVLATDLDTDVVAHGKRGVYSADRIDGIVEDRKKRWFLRDSVGEEVRVKDSLRNLITFKPLNLLQSWPMRGPFDVIFCRNVVIYFDKDTQRTLFDRYADLLAPGGYLFIGHSESLHKVTNRFVSRGRTIYQKVG
ncbi:protein-glutamate O-methyltransferase [Pseudomaricurvus alkylphenolicus]|uniref:CheR family methyltransferase n=1 Tax=Pseudomaricurvus alkylphenolicus TaxID=1306991 RepID=UPI0030B8A37E